jgi:hypothetical protein
MKSTGVVELHVSQLNVEHSNLFLNKGKSFTLSITN